MRTSICAMTTVVRTTVADAIAKACLLVLSLAACTSGARPAPPPIAGSQHVAGSRFLTTHAFYGVPILQRSFFWDGNGEVDDSGIGVHAGQCLDDHVAIGAGSNVATWWAPGSDIYSLEIEALVRVHPDRDWPVFLDGTGGYQLANDDIPPGGTVWNFTFSFGGGLEFPIGKATSLLTGLQYHHISNALGRENERNPSQNEARLWVGVEWNF